MINQIGCKMFKLFAILFIIMGTIVLALDEPDEPPVDEETIDPLLADRKSLFVAESLDENAINQIDCHLRNIDYCFAGFLAANQKALPETDKELEVRCDEMKVAVSCLSVYNQRCQTLKIMSIISPMALYRQSLEQPGPEMLDIGSNPTFQQLFPDQSSNSSKPFDARDLIRICEPDSKNSEANIAIRRRLFQLAKCVNERLPHLQPCFEDLKTALQLFYEPNRTLPMKPSCCAMSRFRKCAIDKLDGICGLDSFDRLIQSLESAGGMSTVKVVSRICREASEYNSQFCLEVLPHSGMKVPPRRGSKASKLARVLNLFSIPS